MRVEMKLPNLQKWIKNSLEKEKREQPLYESMSEIKVNSVHQFDRLVTLLMIVLIISVKSPSFWYLFLTSLSLAAKALWFSGCLMAVGTTESV